MSTLYTIEFRLYGDGMVVEFDIMQTVISKNWNYGRKADETSFYLIGEVGDWLRKQGHDAEIFEEYLDKWGGPSAYGVNELAGIFIQFDDPRLATLFKLTWL